MAEACSGKEVMASVWLYLYICLYLYTDDCDAHFPFSKSAKWIELVCHKKVAPCQAISDYRRKPSCAALIEMVTTMFMKNIWIKKARLNVMGNTWIDAK